MGAGSPGFGRDELARSIGSRELKLRAPQMSLGDLPNGSPQHATDCATESGGPHSGLPRDFAKQTAELWHDYAITGDPGGGGGRKAVFRQKYKSNLSYGKFLANGVISTLCIRF
jgi:hypothetical protein